MEVASPKVTPDRLMQLTGGFAPPLIIETALRLGVFDALEQGGKTIDQLLAVTGASARGLGMLLNGLVGLDLLTKTADERFDLTEESALFLVRQADLPRRLLPDDQRAAAAALGQAHRDRYGRPPRPAHQ